MNYLNKIIALSGPSGSGKTTIMKHLLEKFPGKLTSGISCTTRTPRPDEVNGERFFFLTQKEFIEKVNRKEFIEFNKHFGRFYGTLAETMLNLLSEKSVIMEIDPFGMKNLKRFRANTFSIFVLPPSDEELIKRLKNRGTENEEQIKKRLSRGDSETEFLSDYDYILVNDNLSETFAEVDKLIEKIL